MTKKENIHAVTDSSELEKDIVVITHDPEKGRAAGIRGCCPVGFPLGDVT